MKQSDAIKTLNKISVSQWGLFTSAQAQMSGVSRLSLSRLCEKEFIERLGFGIYKMSSTPSSRLTDIQVAWLSLEPKKFAHERRAQREKDFIVGGHTATYLYEVGDLYPDPYLFLSPRRKQSQRSELSFRMSTLSKDDVRLIDGLPVTSPERTIATLASEGEDLSHIEGVMIGFAKHYTLDESTLGTLLSPHSKKYGFADGRAFSTHLHMQDLQRKVQDFERTIKTNPSLARLVTKNLEPIIQLHEKELK